MSHSRTRSRLAIVARLSLASGLVAGEACSVGPTFTRPQAALPVAWQAANNPHLVATAAADALWWKGFNDPVLDRLVELARRQNLSLQVAGLRIVEARAQWGIATGRQFPQVQEITGSATAIGPSKNIPLGPLLPRHLTEYQLGFDASWEIDFWGKYRRAVDAEAAALLASVADYDASVVSLTAEVARTYVAVRTTEVLIAQARYNADIQDQALKIAQSRFQNGATSELDVSQAATLLQSTRATIPTLQGQLQQARNALSTLLGQPPGVADSLLGGPQEIPQAPAKVAVSVPAEMLRRRPDIRSAEMSAAAQCARIGVAKADLYPSFSLFGSIGLRAAGSGWGGHSFFSSNSFFYQAGPSVSWPFFNYGRIENNVRVQDARFQELLVTYRDTVLRAAQEVEDALAGFLNAQEAAELEQGAVKSAQRSVELSLEQYREGAADYQRVLDAQRSLLDQQNALAQLRSAVATSLMALYKALGGGWETSGNVPFVPEATQNEMKARTNWGDILSQPRSPESSEPPPAGTH
jgi:NodT family efflux transporter outer membrane factor (OMF) lipoprotein